MTLLAALAGACGAGGFVLVVLGFSRPPREVEGRPPARWRLFLRALTDRSRRRRLLAAASTALVVLVVLGWPVGALACAIGAYVLPPMLSGRGVQRRIVRLEALEQWARRLAEVMGASRSLEQTLVDSVRVAPAAVHAPVATLAERLRNRAPTEPVLRAFADELDDPVADLIATELILAAKRRGPGTRDALAALADAVADEVRMRREVEAERASLRTTLLVIVIAIASLSGVFIGSNSLAAPYDTAVGQLVLAIVAGIYATGLAWMRRLAIITTGTRFLNKGDEFARSDGAITGHPRVVRPGG